MPCNLCKSTSHTLAKCNSSIVADLITTVNALLTNSHLNIKEQVDLLKNFSVAQLSVVCRNIQGLPANGSKNESIGYIISNYFEHSADEAIQTYNQLLTNQIDEAYTQLLNWIPIEKDIELKSHIIFNMNIYYYRRYGLHRNMLPIAVFYELAQDISVRLMLNRNSNTSKLLVTVNISSELPIEDCCCCLDKKQMTQFNCKHSCCQDCFISIAKKRTKSFICCPLCRAEIQEVQVINHDSSLKMKEDISSC